MFRELVAHARREFQNVEWDVFLPRNYAWTPSDGVRTIKLDIRSDCLAARLAADHFHVPFAAQKSGCRALVTVGFSPARSSIPVAAHVLTLHHRDPANQTGWLRSQYRAWEVRRVLSKAPLVITNSQVAASELVRIDASVRGRLLVSSEGVQHDVFRDDAPAGEADSIAERYSLSPGYLLWVSNFYPYKQVDMFLRAYAGLSKGEREGHPAVLVGGDWRGSRRSAEQLAKHLGIARNLRFLAWVPEEWLAPLYRNAACHVLASRAETFGRTVLEAMACGTLCVVNDIAIMREVTQGHAIFTDFGDTEAATAALRQGLANSNSTTELRNKGIERSRQFSMRRLARERVAAILERLA